jgi:hypothetical protein
MSALGLFLNKYLCRNTPITCTGAAQQWWQSVPVFTTVCAKQEGWST